MGTHRKGNSFFRQYRPAIVPVRLQYEFDMILLEEAFIATITSLDIPLRYQSQDEGLRAYNVVLSPFLLVYIECLSPVSYIPSLSSIF